MIYFGPTFERHWPTLDELVALDDLDPLAGWSATVTETAAGIVDLQRHAGHADIVREQLDGSVGLLPSHSNLSDATVWSTYTQRLTAIADRFA